MGRYVETDSIKNKIIDITEEYKDVVGKMLVALIRIDGSYADFGQSWSEHINDFEEWLRSGLQEG